MDASRARLFTYERSNEVDGLEEHLTEQRDLVNPARRLRPVELFSESRPGSSRTGDRQFAFDDHRDKHIEALDAEFSRTILGELAALMRTVHVQRVIVCASPNMLGELRAVGLPDDVVVDELARDLVKLTPPQLRDHLERHGLLPAKPARKTMPS